MPINLTLIKAFIEKQLLMQESTIYLKRQKYQKVGSALLPSLCTGNRRTASLIAVLCSYKKILEELVSGLHYMNFTAINCELFSLLYSYLLRTNNAQSTQSFLRGQPTKIHPVILLILFSKSSPLSFLIHNAQLFVQQFPTTLLIYTNNFHSFTSPDFHYVFRNLAS